MTMTTLPRLATASATALLVTLAVAGPAAADDQGFLNYAKTYGMDYADGSPEALLRAGNAICENLTYSNDARVGINYFYRGEYVPQELVDAAQEYLCPETIREPGKPR